MEPRLVNRTFLCELRARLEERALYLKAISITFVV